MSDALVASRDPSRRSWVETANEADTHFPIQNLPFGVFSTGADTRLRVGVAIGDHIVDMTVLSRGGLLTCTTDAFDRPDLNVFLAMGRSIWRTVRIELGDLLDAGCAILRDDPVLRDRALTDRTSATLHLPIAVQGYTDFYSSKEHALSAGAIFRGAGAGLPPNWSELPIGYNGRASSVVVSGTPVSRPRGQVKRDGDARPTFAPSGALDYELEMGFIVGTGNRLGEPIDCVDAETHIFGLVLLNDWSARDLQKWEYVPLGPFNAKGFATSISPWVVTLDALEPFRCDPPVQSPPPLAYLRPARPGGFAVKLEARLQPFGAARSNILTETDFRYMYWTMAQQLAHHTVSGCNMRPGDLCGSGTISGPTPESAGSLLELALNGAAPLQLSDGQLRSFIEDGDEIVLRGWCQGAGYRVGFGECSGRILPAISTSM